MLAIPAIDLRDRHCVQFVVSDPETARLDDPVTVSRQWIAAGFSRLHVMDLDAASGLGNNRDLIRELLRQTTVPVQIGGGVGDADALGALLDDGADWVVVGLPGVDDPAWLAEQAFLAPGRIILAMEVRERLVVSKGWNASTRRAATDLIAELAGAPLAGVLVTAARRTGASTGTDLSLIEDLVGSSPWPVIASGHAESMQDLRNLEDVGVWATVLGEAIYTAALDARVVAEEFAA